MPADAKCRSCDAPVRWVRSSRGERMPIDAEPTADGNIIVDGGVAIVVSATDTTTPRFTSHFATCPQAKEWRRK